MSNFLSSVSRHISAGYQTLMIDAPELHRAERTLMRLPQLPNARIQAVLVWDIVHGFRIQSVSPDFAAAMNMPRGGDLTAVNKMLHPEKPITNPVGALEWLVDLDAKHQLFSFGMFEVAVVMRNFQLFMREPAVYQRWQNYVYNSRFALPAGTLSGKGLSNKDITRLPIILGNAVAAPDSLEDTVARIEFGLPTRDELLEEITKLEASSVVDAAKRLAPEEAYILAGMLLGLQLREASDVIALAIVATGSLKSPEVADIFEEQKAARFKETVGITYHPKRTIGSMSQLGGFAEYGRWIQTRKVCFTPAAAKAGIDPPRGVVLLGPPGTAKSEAAKITARELGLPLLELDLGALFGGVVGQTEANIRTALGIVDAIDGCVLSLDEVDKYVANATGPAGDSGINQRLFGKLLNWLTSKTSNTFVVATANRTTGIPPEFLRRGRFDEIFSTDIPTAEQRQAIAEIHMRKRKIDPAAVFPDADSWRNFVGLTEGFVGSEIEQIVKDAKLETFAETSETTPTAERMYALAKSTISNMAIDGDGIAAIQKFCRDRTRSVAEPRAVHAGDTTPHRNSRPVRPPSAAARSTHTGNN